MKRSLMIVLIFAVVMAALFGLELLLNKNGPEPEAETAETTTETPEQTPAVTNVLDEAHATVVTFSEAHVAVSGAGVAVADGTATVAFPGTYRVGGAVSDGQLVVDCGYEGTVFLILDSVSIQCANGPALYVKQADQTVLVLPAGSESLLRDGAAYAVIEELETQPNAALYASDALVLQGEGVLNVVGAYNNGVRCRDELVVNGGVLNVSAVNDGVKANDYIVVNGGSVNLLAGGDGIQTTSELPGLGYITVNDGSIGITSAGDGVAASGELTVAGGSVAVLAGQGSGHYGDIELSGLSAKGLKGAGVAILGGTVNLDTADDCLSAAGVCVVSGGLLGLSSGDDAIHADAQLIISGGMIAVETSYEGFEAPVLRIDDGVINVNADDDALSAGAGNVLEGVTADACSVTISGGSVTLKAFRGVNSDGAFAVTGGDVAMTCGSIVDSAVKFASGWISGGTLTAAGYLDDGSVFGDGSAQCSVLYTFLNRLPAGTVCTLTDAAGAVVMTVTPDADYETVLLSCPALALGQSYTLSAGEESVTLTLETATTVAGAEPVVVEDTGSTAVGGKKDFGVPGMG